MAHTIGLLQWLMVAAGDEDRDDAIAVSGHATSTTNGHHWWSQH